MLDDSEKDWNRKGALEEIESLKLIRSTAWDEHSHSYRWLMASLLAINGGACLSIYANTEISHPIRLIACGSFIIGIIAALLVAVFGQRSIRKSLVPLQKQIGYWMKVVGDGLRDEEIEADLAKELGASAKTGLASRIAGWVSALGFMAGVISVGFGIEPVSDMSANTKEASAESVEMPADRSFALPNESGTPAGAGQKPEEAE